MQDMGLENKYFCPASLSAIIPDDRFLRLHQLQDSGPPTLLSLVTKSCLANRHLLGKSIALLPGLPSPV